MNEKQTKVTKIIKSLIPSEKEFTEKLQEYKKEFDIKRLKKDKKQQIMNQLILYKIKNFDIQNYPSEIIEDLKVGDLNIKDMLLREMNQNLSYKIGENYIKKDLLNIFANKIFKDGNEVLGYLYYLNNPNIPDLKSSKKFLELSFIEKKLQKLWNDLVLSKEKKDLIYTIKYNEEKLSKFDNKNLYNFFDKYPLLKKIIFISPNNLLTNYSENIYQKLKKEIVEANENIKNKGIDINFNESNNKGLIIDLEEIKVKEKRNLNKLKNMENLINIENIINLYKEDVNIDNIKINSILNNVLKLNMLKSEEPEILKTFSRLLKENDILLKNYMEQKNNLTLNEQILLGNYNIKNQDLKTPFHIIELDLKKTYKEKYDNYPDSSLLRNIYEKEELNSIKKILENLDLKNEYKKELENAITYWNWKLSSYPNLENVYEKEIKEIRKLLDNKSEIFLK